MASELLSYAEFARTVGFPASSSSSGTCSGGAKKKWELQLDQQKALRVIQKEKEDADRKEHQHKWNSMVQSYTDQIRQLIENFNKQQEQQFRLMNRQAEAIELSAELLNKLSAKIDAFMMMKEKQDGRISTNEG